MKKIADEKVRLIFMHNAHNPPIHKSIRKGRTFLERNENAKDSSNNIQISYKQPKNIKQLVGGPSNGGSGRGSPEPGAGCKNAQELSCVKIVSGV